MTAHAAPCRPRVEVVAGRYPYRPACGCGWAWRGYVAAHAAQLIADAHAAGEL